MVGIWIRITDRIITTTMSPPCRELRPSAQVGDVYARINFLIAGDGPKRILLEEVVEKNKLHKR